MKNEKKQNKQTIRNRCSTSRTFYISFHLCRSLPDKDTNWPNLRGYVEKATTRRSVDCEESLLSAKDKRVSGMNVSRETRRKRDAKGIPRVFRPLCLIPKVRITRTIDDKCFPFFSRYVCAVHTSFFAVLVVAIFVSRTTLKKAQHDLQQQVAFMILQPSSLLKCLWNEPFYYLFWKSFQNDDYFIVIALLVAE